MGRADGTLITDVGPLRRMLPSLMPKRNGAVVYYEQQLDLSKTLPWLETRTPPITLYELAIAGLVRVWSERPQLNRFVAGGKLYQRDEIAFSISVKKSLDENAPLTSIKAVFDPNDSDRRHLPTRREAHRARARIASARPNPKKRCAS